MNTLVDKAQLYAWSVAQVVRLGGRPDVALGFLGGIGDDLLCTAPIAEWLRRGTNRLWFFTRHPDLYARCLDHRVRLLPDDARFQRIALRLGRPLRSLSYSVCDATTDRDSAVSEHIIANMCRRAGLKGRVQLRPHLSLASEEVAAASAWRGCIAVQTSSLAASVPMRNKQWRTERIQALVDHFSGRFGFVQIGSAGDPPLRGAHDLRGRTTLRETAAVLAQARLFVGLVGFLMHLARAVDCPSVIVYGGREPPELTGYPCNENVAHRPPCAPCWQRNRCDHGHACMEEISAAHVIAATERALQQPRGSLPVDEVEL